MLTIDQRERIARHISQGWKLPDSLLIHLWEAYQALESANPSQHANKNPSENAHSRGANRPRVNE